MVMIFLFFFEYELLVYFIEPFVNKTVELCSNGLRRGNDERQI